MHNAMNSGYIGYRIQPSPMSAINLPDVSFTDMMVASPPPKQFARDLEKFGMDWKFDVSVMLQFVSAGLMAHIAEHVYRKFGLFHCLRIDE